MELKYPKVTFPTRSWREENGVIYLPPLTSDGTTGPAWIPRLENKDILIYKAAERVLRLPDFKPTSGVTEVVVLKGTLFDNNDLFTKKICAYAKFFRTPDKRKLSKPNAELACLIREKFTDKEIEAMGLWYIVVMHEPIDDLVGVPNLLDAKLIVRGRYLDAYNDMPDDRWPFSSGFAFAVSK